MDLDSRDWLIVIGALLIVGVLLDAWRRYRNDRRNPIRLARRSMGPGGGFARDEPDPASAELPGGGARVVVRDADPEPRPAPVARRKKEPRLEPSIEARERAAPVQGTQEQSTQEQSAREQRAQEQNAQEQIDQEQSAALQQSADAAPGVEEVRHHEIDAEPPPAPAETAAPQPGLSVSPQKDVLFVRVVSRGDGGFGGVDLARIFRECDVRLGAQRVFQRTELARGDGAIQFTVFNGTAQGVFDAGLDESFSTRGLGFLMRLGEPQKPLEAFDCMLETARAVAKYCDGELRDDTNSVFTQQTGEHCRERIRDFALRARARR
jgi:cell division protein ZipA